MATNQTNVTETPDDIIRRFLPDMKRVVNIEDLILYLLSEDAIGDDDPPKLTVSGHLSKTQALVNLQQIIATRGTTEQFMQALERSSELHAGHKDLYDAMVGERQRQMSVSSRRSSASRRTRSSITSQTQLIPVPETSPQADPPSSEEPPPTVIVAESTGASVTHSTSAASPSNTGTGQGTETAPSVRRASQPQTVESAAADNQQHPEIKSFWIGWLFGGLCTIALTLAALAITTIVYGALGIQGKDKCGFSDIRVGAFDVSSGGLLLLLIILVVILMILYTFHKVYLEDHCYLVMLGSVIVLAVIVVLGIAANMLFSFISVAKVVYGDYEMWNPSNIDCSSPSFFSAFTYITAEIVFLALLLIIIVCGFLWYCCCRQ